MRDGGGKGREGTMSLYISWFLSVLSVAGPSECHSAANTKKTEKPSSIVREPGGASHITPALKRLLGLQLQNTVCYRVSQKEEGRDRGAPEKTDTWCHLNKDYPGVQDEPSSQWTLLKQKATYWEQPESQVSTSSHSPSPQNNPKL